MNPLNKKPNVTLSNNNRRRTIMADSYDQWKSTEPEPFTLLSKAQLRVELAEIEKDIAWNEHRLDNIVFGEEDRQQTSDHIDELKGYRAKLLGMIGNG